MTRRSLIVRADEVMPGDDAAIGGYGGLVHHVDYLPGGWIHIRIVTEWGHAASDTFRIAAPVHITRNR